jgi:site-specific recombinase XerD
MRLFELGLNVIEVGTITGHKDLKMLNRYTHLKAETLGSKIRKLQE